MRKRPGRKPYPALLRRTKKVQVPMRADELAQIRRLAQAQKQPVATYLRDKALTS